MSAHVQGTLEATASSMASKATGAGSAMTVFGWATSSDFGMWAGIAIGVLGLAINTYYKRKSDRRSEEAHQAFMRAQSLKDIDSVPDRGREDN